jgi:hypothetical protein
MTREREDHWKSILLDESPLSPLFVLFQTPSIWCGCKLAFHHLLHFLLPLATFSLASVFARFFIPPFKDPRASSHLYHRLFVRRAYRDAGTIAITAIGMKLKPRTCSSNCRTWRIHVLQKNEKLARNCRFRQISNMVPKGWVHQIQDISWMLRITAWYMIHAVHASAVSGPGGKSGWRGSARLQFPPTLTKQFSNKGWRAVQRRHEGATTKGNSRKIAGRPMGAVVARSNQLYSFAGRCLTRKRRKNHWNFMKNSCRS